MFLYNIAFSLEFIVIALGTFLISWGIYQNRCAKHRCGAIDELRTNTAGVNSTTGVAGTTGIGTAGTHGHDSHKKCHHACGTGFAKVIGIILIILALLNLEDTIYCAVKYRQNVYRLHQRIEMMQKNGAFGGGNMNNNQQSNPQNSSY
ncbi:MAG: hypothetical protein JSR33_02970 [Proteobacteria bacterium]|nr:hypothetical protein [Pseudomonadota bacterium]